MSEPVTSSEQSVRDVPNSPIAGKDDLPADVGTQEIRRARANVEITYRARPGEFVDIQQAMFDALCDCGGAHIHRDLGAVFADVDLTEHVVLNGVAAPPKAPS